MVRRNQEGSSYRPPELIEYGEIEELTEQGYGQGPPENPGNGNGGPPWV